MVRSVSSKIDPSFPDDIHKVDHKHAKALPDFPEVPPSVHSKREAFEKAFRAAPHAEFHRHVVARANQIQVPAHSAGKIGRLGAFIAGVGVSAFTKVITFSLCLSTGEAAGLIIPPSLAYSKLEVFIASPEKIEAEIKKTENLIKENEAKLIELREDLENTKRKGFWDQKVWDKKFLIHDYTSYIGHLKLELKVLKKEKKLALKKAQKKQSPTPWDSVSGKVKLFHKTGMSITSHLEAVSNKLFKHALNQPNPKLETIDKKINELFGKGGTAIGVATGAAISTVGITAGMGTGAILAGPLIYYPIAVAVCKMADAHLGNKT